MSSRVRIAVTAMLVVLVLGLVLLNLDASYQGGLVSAKAEASRPVYLDVAVVNEDAGAVVDHKRVNVGALYVDQLQSDQSVNWHLVPRGVAENGMQNNEFQLMVTLPVDLSQYALDVNATDPSAAQITYQVAGGGSPRVQAIAESRGQQIIAGLGRQLSGVFFASIISNLMEAQSNVGSVLGVEDRNSRELATRLNPATKSFSGSLQVIGKAAGESLTANDGTIDSLKSLGGQATGNVQGLDGHVESVQSLLQARAEGRVSYADFVRQLMGLNSSVLSKGVADQYKQLTALGDSLASQVDPASLSDNVVRQIASLQALVVQAQEAVDGQVQGLDAMSDEQIVATYGPGVVAGLDSNGDGLVSLREFLTYVQGDAATGPVTDLTGLLANYRKSYEAALADARAQVARLPYRDGAAVDGAAGLFGGIDGQFGSVPADLKESLATITAWGEAGSIPADSDHLVGSDLPDLYARVDAASQPVPCPTPTASPDPTGSPDPSVSPDPSGSPSAAPTACVWPYGPDVGSAAAAYGSGVERVRAAYEAAAAAVARVEAMAVPSDGIWDTDVTVGVDGVLVAAVREVLTDEKSYLGTVSLRLGKLAGLGSDLSASGETLTGLSKSLSSNAAGQVAVWQATKTQLGQIQAAQQQVAASLAGTDEMTAAQLEQAKSLVVASQALVDASKANTEQAKATKDLLVSFGKDGKQIMAASKGLNAKSDALRDALKKQVAGTRGFSDSFSKVLANAHSSDVLNEGLLDFLADPVAASERPAVASTDVTKPFPWVVIDYSVSFVLAWVLSALLMVSGRRSVFARRRQDWLAPNVLSLGIIAAVALVAATVATIVSANDLGVGRESFPMWAAVVVLTVLEFTLLASWLVRQFRRAGVAVVVFLLVGYVFTSNAVGAMTAPVGVAGVLMRVSPLNQAEASMMTVLSGGAPPIASFGLLAVWVLVLTGLNLMIRHDWYRLVPKRWRPAGSPA